MRLAFIPHKAIVKLKSIPKEDLLTYFQKWKERWSTCFQSQNKYFNENNCLIL